MMRNTNFRANYLEKISGVESGDTLSAEAARLMLKEQILSNDSDIDLTKLAQFAVKHQIPECYHIAVWKLLLGVSSCYFGSRSSVEKVRIEEAEMVIRSLQIMRKTGVGLPPQFVEPTSSDIIKMIKLTNSSISISTLSRSTPISVAEHALHYISEQVFVLCTPSCWVDAYWLTLKFSELFSNSFDENPKILNVLIDEVLVHVRNLRMFHKQRYAFSSNNLEGGIAATSKDEYPRIRFLSNNSKNKFEEVNNTHSRIPFYPNFFNYFNDFSVINIWFRSGGSSIMSSEPLYRLWDRLSTGETVGVLLKFTLIELITLLCQLLHSAVSLTFISDINSEKLDMKNEETLKSLVTRDLQMRAVTLAVEYGLRMGIFNTRKIEF